MKKPTNYELKKWINDNLIVGLKIHYYQSGTDTANTYWELFPQLGCSRRILSNRVSDIVDLKPDWSSVLRLKHELREELEDYEMFEKENRDELIEYERLKAKFEGG